jgi:predicted SnoaL-like aldol condensation-catalyzing enzyme
MARDVEQEARHKALALEAFDALFNRRDFEAERYWSPGYVQHSAGIGPGRDGLFALVQSVMVATRVGWPSPRATTS